MATALTIKNLSKTYANGFQALDDITFNVQRGDFFALLGPNGAGKSTTLGIVSGLTEKTSGSVEIMDIDIEHDLYGARRVLGVVPQEFNFNQFEKVIDIIITQAGYFGLKKHEVLDYAETLLKELDLWDKRNTPSRMLSGGMKRRLMIARALIHKPQVLILDEPTAGVDIELRRSMWEFMKKLNEEEGTTIILTTHYLEEAEQLCRNIGIINKGKLIRQTSTKQLLTETNVESFIFDLEEPLVQGISLPEYEYTQVNEDQLQIMIKKEHSLNNLFDLLSAQGIRIRSLRPSSNRLEELFVNMVSTGNSANKSTGSSSEVRSK